MFFTLKKAFTSIGCALGSSFNPFCITFVGDRNFVINRVASKIMDAFFGNHSGMRIPEMAFWRVFCYWFTFRIVRMVFEVFCYLGQIEQVASHLVIKKNG